YRPHSENACRVELRSPDPAANPYLAFAVMLAAGLAGIEEGLELMPPADEAAPLGCTRQQHCERGLATLPETLGEAVELFAESALMRETLG
ncbi:glutamine synthetase, partial [Vibrio parahaemolyticus]|nr:glutamine synthetase [Vibrio parahaemolyticus]